MTSAEGMEIQKQQYPKGIFIGKQHMQIPEGRKVWTLSILDIVGCNYTFSAGHFIVEGFCMRSHGAGCVGLEHYICQTLLPDVFCKCSEAAIVF